MSQEALKAKRYWFTEDDLLVPIDWDYVNSLPNSIRLGLELYMEGRVSIGRAAEIAGLPVTEFDYIRAEAKIPVRGPDD
jgi:hypothetical protein